MNKLTCDGCSSTNALYCGEFTLCSSCFYKYEQYLKAIAKVSELYEFIRNLYEKKL